LALRKEKNNLSIMGRGKGGREKEETEY
jgi:hypothetical protein